MTRVTGVLHSVLSPARAVAAYALLACVVVACTTGADARGGRDHDSAAAGGAESQAPVVAGNAHDAPSSAATGTSASTEAAAPAPVADTLLADAAEYAGWRSFNINCQSCHGLNAVASDVAPDLRNSVRKGGTVTHAEFREVVKKGRMAKGMPAWGALLDAKQIDEIYAYLLARSSGALGAGQPSVGGE
jgi:mono/diheme cytochrome c family protein